MEKRPCFGCETKEELMKIDVSQLIEDQLALELDRVSDEVWLQRQQICLNCPFRNQETCSKCGCFYQFRTALNHKRCPVGKW